jgi:hypothetical protein
MISRARIEDWIRQVQAAPAAAPIIIRQITDRLLELDAMNESLRAENLELTSGNRIREYEKKIAELEFQLDLLKRQVSEEPAVEAIPPPETLDLLLYNDRGQLLRFQLEPAALADRVVAARIGSNFMPESYRVGLVPVDPRDRLLFLYSSGRTADLPVDEIPLSRPGELQWENAYTLNVRSMEELVAVLPITRLSWFSHGIQVSRFGYARKLAASYLQSFISSHNAGKGVKFDFDRVLALVLCNEEDLFVAISKNGTALSLGAASLPITLDEILRFKVGDFLVAAFSLAAEQSLVALTQAGVAYRQPAAWFQSSKPAERKTRSLGGDKTEAGLALAGAAAAGSDDWGILLREDGDLLTFKIEGISPRGTPIYPLTEARALALAVFSRR